MIDHDDMKSNDSEAASVEFIFAEPKNVFFRDGFLRMEIPKESVKRAAEAGARLIIRKHANFYIKVMTAKKT